ncbi:hypothetical protein BH24CHL4_BH24CHL4_08530 [soil metagenome]
MRLANYLNDTGALWYTETAQLSLALSVQNVGRLST